ncbi:hypothetical protein GGS24DRAFT_238132 [Hypoxylon argillaceum]|nr:hypothetical protein GGS24DRAFT_238132 [Hypoxylon argillaceum]KAI1153001.1 hypothetical protein F4825DRAFT_285695 [Nemania diffusa]
MGSRIYSHVLGGAGDITSGVAAKARGIPHINPCLANRNARLRQRTVLRTLHVPAQIMEGSGLRRDSMFSPQTGKMVFSETMTPVELLPGPDTLRPLDVDTDTETTVSTETGTDINESWPNIAKVSSRTSHRFVDLSNYLDASHTSDDADTMMRQLDSAPLTRESSCDTDSYGWEMEYDRQIDCGNANIIRGCHRLGCHGA